MENVDKSNRPYNIELLKLGHKVPINEKLSIGIVQMAIVMFSTVISIYLFRYNVNIIGLRLNKI